MSTRLAARCQLVQPLPPLPPAAPVRNSHSARCSSSAKASSCRRSQASSGSSAAPAVEIGQRRGIGGRRFGALGRRQVELGEPLALLGDVISAGAAVELVRRSRRSLSSQLLRRRVRREQPADPQMHRRPLALGNERIGRLLDAVVQEAVGSAPAGAPARPVPPPRAPRRAPPRCRPWTMASVATAASLPRQASCCSASCVCRRQALELADHQVDHVVGVALGVNACEVPATSALRHGRSASSALVGQRGEELDGEERIAAGLLVHQLGQRRGDARGPQCSASATSRPTSSQPERRQHDLAAPARRRPRIAASVRISGCAASTSLSR